MADKITVTPDTAYGYLDGVVAKYQGTRDDHRVLDLSLKLMAQVIHEWKMYKDTYGPVGVATKPEPTLNGAAPSSNGEVPPKNKSARTSSRAR
jgi:hypothetical protein